MSSMDAVRARFAHNEGLPFVDILTEASIRDVLDEHGASIGTECSARLRPSGAF